MSVDTGSARGDIDRARHVDVDTGSSFAESVINSVRVAGAVGAFCVLLAFGAKGSPAVVMSIVFGGAPVVNAIVAVALHPPAGGLAGVQWPFVLGILMAAAGGCLVTLYRPH